MSESIEVPKVITVKIDDLKPFPGNPNTHPDNQIAQIVGSIQEFGWTRPIVINGNNVILAGHGAVEAAKLAGLTKITASVKANLTPIQEKAYVIADNQLAANSDRSLDLLEALVREIIASNEIDPDLLAIPENELKRILARDSDGKKDGEQDYHDPIIQFNIVFDDESQQDQWFAFMKHVRTVAHGESFAESLSQWISDNVEFDG